MGSGTILELEITTEDRCVEEDEEVRVDQFVVRGAASLTFHALFHTARLLGGGSRLTASTPSPPRTRPPWPVVIHPALEVTKPVIRLGFHEEACIVLNGAWLRAVTRL